MIQNLISRLLLPWWMALLHKGKYILHLTMIRWRLVIEMGKIRPQYMFLIMLSSTYHIRTTHSSNSSFYVCPSKLLYPFPQDNHFSISLMRKGCWRISLHLLNIVRLILIAYILSLENNIFCTMRYRVWCGKTIETF